MPASKPRMIALTSRDMPFMILVKPSTSGMCRICDAMKVKPPARTSFQERANLRVKMIHNTMGRMIMPEKLTMYAAINMDHSLLL